ncbi:acylphosphatase [Phototrophicus methaneseepsis]|uniref:Acylphosphatase n=1 Tax=Phototrophicus methaneseepsis TaxID=2710758 RepID=A0A7S8E6K6_9CHLR|nr:acylphosphatase [Phototrophicus methaneseepsis]QPC81311.1 acylphosphatase [Phototrophicus methaneseepsis]
MKRLHAIVHGHVQGVYFRATTQDRAVQLSITGWVRNNADGTVEVIAEGSKDKLEVLHNFLLQGPPSARDSSVDVNWSDAAGTFYEFTVQR